MASGIISQIRRMHRRITSIINLIADTRICTQNKTKGLFTKRKPEQSFCYAPTEENGCICRFALGFCKNKKKRTETLYQSFSPFMVEYRGVEPLASTMRMSRADKAGTYTPRRDSDDGPLAVMDWFGMVEFGGGCVDCYAGVFSADRCSAPSNSSREMKK